VTPSQPHHRQRFASRSVEKGALFSVSNWEQAVAAEFVNWLIPRNLGKRRRLQVSHLY
jgi:hypothetical protein